MVYLHLLKGLRIVRLAGCGKLSVAEGLLLVTIRKMVLGLLDLPGSRYSCVAELESGRILIESGSAMLDPAVVLRWGMEAATVLEAATEGGMEDFIMTSRGHYHLLRPLGGPRSLLVYLCVDRTRANLAAARRELAAARPEDDVAQAMTASPPEPLARLPPAVSRRVAAAMPPASTVTARRSATADGARVAEVPLPRRTSPTALPSAAPPPRQRKSADPVLAQPWADDVATMNRLLTALRAMGDHAKSTRKA
jgi:hypothetical protein